MGCTAPKPSTENIIAIRIVNGHIEKKDKVRYNKDGTIDKRKCNKKSGESSEVFAFKTKEEIEANLAAGKPFVIRQNIPNEGTTTFHDELYGDITVENAELDDMI